MVTNKERIDAETQIRKLREDREYNEKVAALFEDKKKEQIKRKKTDDAIMFAFKNALLISSLVFALYGLLSVLNLFLIVIDLSNFSAGS